MIKKILSTILFYFLVAVFTFLYSVQFLIFYFLRKQTKEPVDISVEPSCLNDTEIGDHGSIFVKNRNVEIHYVCKGDPTKPLMLFVHGFPEFWYSWRHQLKEFHDDYFVVAMDLTGYGDSGKPTEVQRYHPSEIAEDIKEFVLELGYDSCILVGHDWGGAITYLVTQNFPEIVDKMIVMNAPHSRSMRKKSFKQFLTSSYFFFFQTPFLPEYLLSMGGCSCLDMLQKGLKKDTFTDEDLMAYKYTFVKNGFTAPLNYYRNMFSLRRGGSSAIHVPSLIIWGTEDKALGKELAALSAEAIDACVVKYVEGASHWVNQEYPEEVNKIMREYLA